MTLRIPRSHHVPLLDVNVQNHPIADELSEAFQRVLRSGKFILGEEVEGFENEVAAFLGVNHAVGVSSGTDALLLALMALDIGPGDEVICPSFTFVATAGSIARVGATPVFVDSLPATFNVDIASAEAAITPRTRAIMPVHLYGQAADMDAVLSLARKYDLHVIEDAAQALGAKFNGRPCGTFAEFGAFSFFPSKNLGALGDAGLLVANDDALAEKARILRMHGMSPKYYNRMIGGNFRIDALQSAFLRVKLGRYDDYTAARQSNASRYTEQLSKLDGVSTDPDAPRITLPMTAPQCDHIWNQYTLRVKGARRRDHLRRHLQDVNVSSEIYYPVPLHRQECFASEGRLLLPVAERLADEVLSIPIYPGLQPEQQDHVVGAIAEFTK